MDISKILSRPIDRLNEIKAKFGGNTLVILFFVYWAQGFKSLSSLATTLYMKDTLKLDPSTTQLLRTLIIIAWLIKPLYGFITDNFPLFGYHRRSYLFLMGVIGILSMLSILFHENIYAAVAALLVCELSQAFSDVIADALMVEKSRNDESGSSLLQSFSWSVLAFGGILGSLLGGIMLTNFKPATVIAANAISPLLLAISSCYLDENPIVYRSMKEQFKMLLNSVKEPMVYRPLLFVIIIRGTCPRFSELYSYYLLDVLKLSPVFMSNLGIIAYCAMIIGGTLYHNFLKKKEYRNILCEGLVIVAGLYLIDLALVLRLYEVFGLPGWSLVLGGEIVGVVIDTSYISMPILVLGAKICPKGVEGTFFALFSSVYNIGSSISGLSGGYIMKAFDIKAGNYSLFWLLVVIQIVTKLIPLLFLQLLPKSKEPEFISEVELQEEKEEDIILEELGNDLSNQRKYTHLI